MRGFEVATVHLVRHGKASARGSLHQGAHADAYDRLHADGQRQSTLLGADFARRSLSFDQVFCGPMARHAQTLLAIREMTSHLPWPVVQHTELLREVAMEQLLRARLPQLLASVPALQALWSESESQPADAQVTENSQLAQVIGYVGRAWKAGELSAPGVETWEVFRERVRLALAMITGASRGASNVLVVSSLGVISSMLDLVQGDRPESERTMPFRWLFTSSVSQVVANESVLTVTSINDVRHLADEPSLITVM